MDYFSRGYTALRGDKGAPQSANDTIDKLCDRLLNGNSLEDRRAALLGLKGLSRDWKSEVGSRALPILLGVLQEDAPEDIETAKAVVETLSLLCEVEEVDGRPVRDDSGVRNTDGFLATPAPLHMLLDLLTSSHFYLRFFSLQLLGILLSNRSTLVQAHVLTAAGGVGRLVETLDDAREIIRNESLLLIIALTASNADIQKLLAFEGAFDKLFAIIKSEGGIGGGGIVVQDCLAAVSGLLRYNVSNQNYFRETSCIPLLAPLLLFPQSNPLTSEALSAFALQSWSEQKVINAGLVITLIRMLVGGAGSGRSGNQKALLASGVTRCLAEMALASNAPAVLKSQSLTALADILRLSPPNLDAFSTLIVSPLIPPIASSSDDAFYPSSTNEDRSMAEASEQQEAASSSQWQRGELESALFSTIELCIHGDGTPGREGLRVRAAAAGLFESYVFGNTDAQFAILSSMATPTPESNPNSDQSSPPSSGSVLLEAIRDFPTPIRGQRLDSYAPFFSCLLFSHLLLHSDPAKEIARSITLSADHEDDEERVSLVSIIVGNLMMAQREQAQSTNAGAGPERSAEWDRLMVGYLIVLSIWLWESPPTVKMFLSEGSNLQVLIQPVTQSSGVDSMVQGLCAFLLGICYEFNREPGPITRETLHPILQSRVGPDQFVSRIMRLREDPRFRSVGSNVLEMLDDEVLDDLTQDDGIWFDYTFVEFLKTNYVSVQRAVLLDPDSSDSNRHSTEISESSEMVTNLQSIISSQVKDIEEMRARINALEGEREVEQRSSQMELDALLARVQSLETEMNSLQMDKVEADKEQEDLLVLLEELSIKRKRDKAVMRNAKIFAVSSDEEEDDDDEEANLS